MVDTNVGVPVGVVVGARSCGLRWGWGGCWRRVVGAIVGIDVGAVVASGVGTIVGMAAQDMAAGAVVGTSVVGIDVGATVEPNEGAGVGTVRITVGLATGLEVGAIIGCRCGGTKVCLFSIGTNVGKS